ncbi:MAG: phosphotransferase family protein [Gammaproteobacteria bacterium]|nr:phosphotransferase family protein [Gammaproteobacteria bacterium]
MKQTLSHVDPEFRSPAASFQLDLRKLSIYLSTQGVSLSTSTPPRQFAGGFGNLNFLIEVDHQPMVLRRPPPGPLPPGANDMAREFKVLSRLWRHFPLAPRATIFCDDNTVLGVPFFLMEYRPGLVVRSTLPVKLKGKEALLSEMMIATLADLHAIPPRQVDLEDLGHPDEFLDRAVQGWIKRAAVATNGNPPPAAIDLGRWLQNYRTPVSKVALLHNDFKLDNIILDPKHAGHPVAVIDWDMCTRGDPLFDLATLLSYWAEPDDPPAMRELKQMPTTNPGFLSRQEVAERYAQRTDLDLSEFLFYRVLAVFKLGVVFMQLHARYRRGETHEPRFGEFDKLANGLLGFALDVARGRGF